MPYFHKWLSCGQGESQPICKGTWRHLTLHRRLEAPSSYPSLACLQLQSQSLHCFPSLFFSLSWKKKYLSSIPHLILPPHCSSLSQRRWLLLCWLVVFGVPAVLALCSCCSGKLHQLPTGSASCSQVVFAGQALHTTSIPPQLMTPLTLTQKNRGYSQGPELRLHVGFFSTKPPQL